MSDQHGYVIQALTKRRNPQANHIESVIQILAEVALSDALLKVLVRCGDHPHLYLNRAVSANAVEATLAEHPKQPGLQIERHVTNFVKKQGTAVRLLKTTAPHGLRTGKCTPFMAKELRLKQIFRDRRGVDGYEWSLGSR